jgi:hypothetical protein
MLLLDYDADLLIRDNDNITTLELCFNQAPQSLSAQMMAVLLIRHCQKSQIQVPHHLMKQLKTKRMLVNALNQPAQLVNNNNNNNNNHRSNNNNSSNNNNHLSEGVYDTSSEEPMNIPSSYMHSTRNSTYSSFATTIVPEDRETASETEAEREAVAEKGEGEGESEEEAATAVSHLIRTGVGSRSEDGGDFVPEKHGITPTWTRNSFVPFSPPINNNKNGTNNNSNNNNNNNHHHLHSNVSPPTLHRRMGSTTSLNSTAAMNTSITNNHSNTNPRTLLDVLRSGELKVPRNNNNNNYISPQE